MATTINSTTTTTRNDHAVHNKSLYWGIAAAIILAFGVIWAVMAYRGRTDVPVSTAPTSSTTTPSVDSGGANAVAPGTTSTTTDPAVSP